MHAQLNDSHFTFNDVKLEKYGLLGASSIDMIKHVVALVLIKRQELL